MKLKNKFLILLTLMFFYNIMLLPISPLSSDSTLTVCDSGSNGGMNGGNY